MRINARRAVGEQAHPRSSSRLSALMRDWTIVARFALKRNLSMKACGGEDQ